MAFRTEHLADGVTLICGDCRDVLPTLDYADVVVTDPPYPLEFQHLYVDLAREAARILPVGGSLVALCGHYQVPALTHEMGKHLRFWWIAGMSHNTLAHLPGKWVCVRWKPALWFVNQRRLADDKRCPMDMLNGGGQDKEHHEWGQPVAWFQHWIEHLTQPGDIVLDPFMGAGTTGVAAVRMGRSFVGVEIDAAHYETALRRVSAALKQGDMFIEKPKPAKQEALL